MLLLVSGRFRLDLTVGSTTLERPGDYVVWGPGIDHSCDAVEDYGQAGPGLGRGCHASSRAARSRAAA
jgi:hypothetical protein